MKPDLLSESVDVGQKVFSQATLENLDSSLPILQVDSQNNDSYHKETPQCTSKNQVLNTF